MNIFHILGKLVDSIIGLLFLSLGLVGATDEFVSPPIHFGHFGVFVIIAIFGASMIRAESVLPRVKQLIDIFVPLLPVPIAKLSDRIFELGSTLLVKLVTTRQQLTTPTKSKNAKHK